MVGIVLQHELQRQQTMTQTLQLGGMPGPAPAGPPAVTFEGERLVELGPFVLGADESEPWAYDNGHAAHDVSLPALRIDRALVCNADAAGP